MTKLKKSGRKGWKMAMKKLIEYSTSQSYLLSEKSFKQSLSADTTITLE